MTCALDFYSFSSRGRQFFRRSILRLDHVLGVVLTTLRVGAKIHVVATKTECTTENLDHTSAQDYSAQHTAVFESGVDVGLMAQCNNVEVAGGPKSVEITWKGSGTWAPSEVKLEVSRAYFYACTPLTGISQDGV